MSRRVLVLGEKESFLIRVLVNKMNEAGIATEFVKWDINTINAKWEGTALVALYMDEGCRPKDDVLHFLIDHMDEQGIHAVTVGEREDVTYVNDHIPSQLIYKTFFRPINNDEFIASTSELFQKVEAGEFKKNILIVDDDANYLNLVRDWLKDKYKVTMATSGMQAIKWLGKNKADLILLDHEMPITTGPQVLEMLRSEEETRNIPVMFLTGKGDKESVMAVLALKPEGYFLKNIGKAELLEKLNDFFVLHK